MRLDDLYRMTAYIYHDKNLARTPTATFAHFVEVCGLIALHDGKKYHNDKDITDAVCKALAWYFPLLARLKISSVESIVYRKFPGVCPYCRLSPHDDTQCKTAKRVAQLPDAERLSRLYSASWGARPADLDGWRAMFQHIYPRSHDEQGRSTIKLLEELGELAEAIRVFDLYPSYFLGEAADVFSYLMGIANEHGLQLSNFSLTREYLGRYPGACLACGGDVCTCPEIPLATVGRTAKEIAIRENEEPFFEDGHIFLQNGARIAARMRRALSLQRKRARGSTDK